VVEKLGGEVVVLPLLPGRSSSATIEHIRAVGEAAGDVDGITSPSTGVRS